MTAAAYEVRGTLLQLLAPISDSPGATASIQLVRTMAELGRLQRMGLREVWETEAQDFTPWLAEEENLSFLAGTLGMELELASQETSVGPFRADMDILCRNADDGSWVLIENQLERTDHRHLGQLLAYAAGLHAVTVCWIAASFTDEHRATLDWLNGGTEDRLQFFGLEVELWRIGDSQTAPKFNVVSKPKDWVHTVRAIPESATPVQQAQLEFWSALMKRLDEEGSPVKPRRPRQQNWMEFGIGRSEFSLEAKLQSREKRISVQLFVTGSKAVAYYRLLERQREKI